MSTSIKSLTKQTLIYGMGTILTRLLTFILLPLYTNVFEPKVYGVVALVFAFLAFMNIIYNYGMDTAFLRFYNKYEDKAEKETTLSSALVTAILSSLILSAVIFLFRAPLAKVFFSDNSYSHIMGYAAIILLLDCLCRVPFAFLRQQEKPLQFMGIRLINVLITFSLNILFVVRFEMGIEGIFRSNIIASATTLILLYLLIFRSVRFRFSKETTRSMIRFGLPLVPAGLASMAMEMLNRYIIEDLLGLEAVGIFSAGLKLGIFMVLIATAFYYAWQPFFLKAGNTEESKKMFSRVLTYYTALTVTVWILLTAFINEIVNLSVAGYSLIGKEYQGCVVFVPIILLGYIFYGINYVFMPGIYFENKTKYIAYITGFAATVSVGANFLLIPILGVTGSAVASLIGYITLATTTYFVSRKYLRVEYEFGRVGLLLLLAIMAVLPIYFLDLVVWIRLLIIVGFPVLLKLLGFFKADELSALKALLSGKRR